MNLVLKKPARQVATEEALSPLAELIDEVGALARRRRSRRRSSRPSRTKLKPFDVALKKLIVAIDALAAPDATGVEKSEHFVAEFGKRSVSRSIKDMAKLRALMGDKLFLACVRSSSATSTPT